MYETILNLLAIKGAYHTSIALGKLLRWAWDYENNFFKIKNKW